MFARRSAVVIGTAMFIGSIGAVAEVGAHGANVPADGCKPLDVPSHLPGVNAFFDSAALVLNTTTADASFKKKIVIAIGLTSTPSADFVEGGDASPAADSIFRGVIAALRPTAADSALAFRVVLQGCKPLKVKMDKAEICAPKLVSGGEDRAPARVPMTTGRVVSKTPTNRPPPGLPASAMRVPGNPKIPMPRLHIDATGQVVDVKPDGKDGEVDEETRILWLGRKFAPATLDGVAVEVWHNGSKTELVSRTK